MSTNQQLDKNTPIDKYSQPDLSIQPTFPHILLVDDNPTNLKVLSDALQRQGWKTLVATDGESAIEQAEYITPDLILLDVMMPGMNGFETCRKLKANPVTRSIPVIFMTALSNATNKVEGLEIGAVDYITKPFQQEEVIARLKLHLKLSQLNQTLEQQVQERTAELTQSLQQLQQTQLQLIQSEKMSTLGQLVAGIGHEINNPIGFISGNLVHVKNYTGDLLRLVNLYQVKSSNSDPDITNLIEEIDLEYLTEDLPKLFSSLAHGVERLQDISLSLRTFARSDISHKIAFQIHEGIDSALMLLKHRLKANDDYPEIEVVKEYDDLPLIDGYPGQLNQVFMNILANAIDALVEMNQKRHYSDIKANPSRIEIHTQLDASGEHVIIQIRDNGIGMPEEIKQRVFDHLFTTKVVGKGTGLGLAIAHQIVVEKHKGTISVNSTAGEGTEFVITLPVKASD
jgi:signal transduction histidine kinase